MATFHCAERFRFAVQVGRSHLDLGQQGQHNLALDSPAHSVYSRQLQHFTLTQALPASRAPIHRVPAGTVPAMLRNSVRLPMKSTNAVRRLMELFARPYDLADDICRQCIRGNDRDAKRACWARLAPRRLQDVIGGVPPSATPKCGW